jgi:hypothetical protein
MRMFQRRIAAGYAFQLWDGEKGFDPHNIMAGNLRFRTP